MQVLPCAATVRVLLLQGGTGSSAESADLSCPQHRAADSSTPALQAGGVCSSAWRQQRARRLLQAGRERACMRTEQGRQRRSIGCQRPGCSQLRARCGCGRGQRERQIGERQRRPAPTAGQQQPAGARGVCARVGERRLGERPAAVLWGARGGHMSTPSCMVLDVWTDGRDRVGPLAPRRSLEGLGSRRRFVGFQIVDSYSDVS